MGNFSFSPFYIPPDTWILLDRSWKKVFFLSCAVLISLPVVLPIELVYSSIFSQQPQCQTLCFLFYFILWKSDIAEK